MSAPAVPAGGASVLDRLQVLRFAPTPLRGAPAATWTQSPRTGVGQLPVPGTGLQPWLHDTTTTSTDPAGSTLATPDFGPKNGVHLITPQTDLADWRATFTRADGTLVAHSVTNGRQPAEQVDAVATYGGSAFRLPPGGEPLLTLAPAFISLLAEVAWQFSDTTPHEQGADRGSVGGSPRGRQGTDPR